MSNKEVIFIFQFSQPKPTKKGSFNSPGNVLCTVLQRNHAVLNRSSSPSDRGLRFQSHINAPLVPRAEVIIEAVRSRASLAGFVSAHCPLLWKAAISADERGSNSSDVETLQVFEILRGGALSRRLEDPVGNSEPTLQAETVSFTDFPDEILKFVAKFLDFDSRHSFIQAHLRLRDIAWKSMANVRKTRVTNDIMEFLVSNPFVKRMLDLS